MAHQPIPEASVKDKSKNLMKGGMAHRLNPEEYVKDKSKDLRKREMACVIISEASVKDRSSCNRFKKNFCPLSESLTRFTINELLSFLKRFSCHTPMVGPSE